MSVSHYNEKQVLHDLPYFQLGPSDDVLALNILRRFLLVIFGGVGGPCVAYMGIVYHDISRKVLGDDEFISAML